MLESQKLAAEFAFRGQDLPTLLAHWARHRGDKTFLIWEPMSAPHRSWSYAQFWWEVRRVAAGMHARGIGRGDRVLIHSDNCPEMVFAWYACATLGALAITTNTASVADELAHAAGVTGVRAAITQSRYAQLVQEGVPGLEWLAVIDAGSGANAPGEPLGALLGDPEAVPAREPEPLLPAGIVFTSGTTSRPKGVVHTHANMLWAGRLGSYVLNFGADDTHFAQLPFFHVNAQSWSTAVALAVGGSVVLLPKPTINQFWEVVIRHGITHMSVMPLAQRTLQDQPCPGGHRLKVLQSGIAPEPFASRAGASSMAAYGMSELVTYAIHSDIWQSWPPGCIGRPAAGYEMKLVNPATGEPCGPEEDGELWVRGVRGVHLFLEYFNNPEANARAFTEDGWFMTGDMLRMNADGVLFYRDRDKDRIKVGGENISAGEVEATLARIRGVHEVAVVAQPHPRLDEVPVAVVVRGEDAPAEDALRDAIFTLCEQKLSRFKRPRAIYFIDELPIGTLNKVSKVKLREMARAAVS
jgi:crotonobetaine/carnitine-CoA ligase